MLPILSTPAERSAYRRASSFICKNTLSRRASSYAHHQTDPFKLIVEINSQVAIFRDLLVHCDGGRRGGEEPNDCPELREKIRKTRRSVMQLLNQTTHLIMPQIKTVVADGIVTDSTNLVLLFYLAQLFAKELGRSYHLLQVIPMDMSAYYENRAGPSNLGNVISQILLCKQITPDFNEEELCSIVKDVQEVTMLISEMQEYMPQQELHLEKERTMALTREISCGPLSTKNRRKKLYQRNLLCCISRPNYL